MKLVGALSLGFMFFLCGKQAVATPIDYTLGYYDSKKDVIEQVKRDFEDNVSAIDNFLITSYLTPGNHSYVFQMFIDNDFLPFHYEDGWVLQSGNEATDGHLQGGLAEEDLQFGEGYIAVGPARPLLSILVEESSKWLIASEEWRSSKIPERTINGGEATSNSQGHDIEAQAVDKTEQNHEIEASSLNKILVKSIKCEIEKDHEKVFIALNNFSTPKILIIKGDNPRIVIDIKNVSSWGGQYKTPINGNFIKQVRTHLHRDIEKLRIVLDMNPSENYSINKIYYRKENIFYIEVIKK